MSCDNLKVVILFIYILKICACFDDAFNKTKEHAYLDSLINELKNETWNEGETACKEKMLSLLKSVQNFTLWATWVWDSMETKPIGSLYGSQYQLGNYDQCLSSPVSPINPELMTQYCLADIKIEGESLNRSKSVEPLPVDPYGKADLYVHTPSSFGQDLRLITWGVCVPASCHPQSVQRFVYQLLRHSQFSTTNVSINIESCEKADKDLRFTTRDYLFFGLIGSIVSITIISTYIYNRTRRSITKQGFLKIVSCFSISENFRKLTVTNEHELSILNGIRFMTSALVILLHQVFFMAGAAVGNKVESEKLLSHVYTLWLLHADTMVDTFFMLSGILLVTTCLTMKELTIRNLGKHLMKRYFRLMATAALLILFLTTTVPSLGYSGPLWSKAVAREVNCCRRNWWLSLLMINNYIERENMCFPVIWSIYCDFHFSIVGTALVYFYGKNRRVGIFIFQTLLFVALIVPGIYTELYKFPPLFMLNVEVFKDYRTDLFYKEMYIASHNRLSAYLVGMIFGYVLYSHKPNDLKKSISKCWSIVGASFALGLMICVLLLGKSYYSREYSRVEAVLYASLNRPLWAFGVGLIILCCVYGSLPHVEGYLGWFVFRPLGRLTYGVYMVHVMVLMIITYMVRSPQYIAIISTTIQFFGVLVLSCFISLLLWLFVEAPVANLINLLLAKKNFNLNFLK